MTTTVARWDSNPRVMGDMLKAMDGDYVKFTDHERVVWELKNRIDVYDISQVCDKEEIAKQAIVIRNKEFTNETLRAALAASRAEVEGLRATLQKAWEDVNWMTNEGTLLNRECFKYLDAALEKGNV